MPDTRARQPAGSPDGGQFASSSTTSQLPTLNSDTDWARMDALTAEHPDLARLVRDTEALTEAQILNLGASYRAHSDQYGEETLGKLRQFAFNALSGVDTELVEWANNAQTDLAEAHFGDVAGAQDNWLTQRSALFAAHDAVLARATHLLVPEAYEERLARPWVKAISPLPFTTPRY